MNLKNVLVFRSILFHLLFWIGVWFLYFYFFSYNSDDQAYVIWFSSLLIPLSMAVTYFAVYFLIPRYLLKRAYGKFFLYSFYVIVASSYFIVLIIYGCLIFLKKWDATNIPPMMKNFFFVLILVYLVAGVVGFINVLNHNFKTDRKNKELHNKILTTQLQLKEQELHYLKMQIHPHFLFNTLNTIYGFAIQQSRQTPELILRFSNFLDYILYQINQPKVSLKEEVAHIGEYIELERTRFQETLRIEFNSTSIQDHIMVPPMLLMPFVENAFKHGTLKDGYIRIAIDVSVVDDRLEFKVQNSAETDEEQVKGNGIGLENIKKRLELHYADQYRLNQEMQEGIFLVHLIIDDLKALKNA